MMSEQAPNKDKLPDQGELTDQMPGASTFPGEPTSGGWIPILCQPKEGGRPFIGDWLCPVCSRLTGHSKTCPNCGLGIKEHPPRKSHPITKSRLVSTYRLWEYYEGIDHGQARRQTRGADSFRQPDHKHRPCKTAKNKQQRRHTAP